MAYQKSDGGNRSKRKSLSGKPGKGGDRYKKRDDRKDQSNSADRHSFISKFSKKKSDSTGSAGFSPRGERKKFDDSRKDFGKPDSVRPDKRMEGSSAGPHRSFSVRKKYFKTKGADGPEESKLNKKKSFDQAEKGPSFGREKSKKSFNREDRRKPFGRPGTLKPKKYTSYKEKRFVEKPKDGLIRLNKYISNSGVCSRREADELIKMGLISVNGQVITEMGYKVKPTDDVRHESKKLTAEKPVYILLNKPKGFITTTDDPQERKTVMHLIGSAVKERIYPVGRLDRNTTGLLLLTNDGELAERLTHPSYKAKKIYRVELNKDLTKADFDKIIDGIRFEEGKAMVDDLAYVDDSKNIVGIELHIGWNRIVRRIFEALGYEVLKLDRVVYAGLDKKNIGRGEWRFLRQDEVTKLKHFK